MNRQEQLWGKAEVSMRDLCAHSPIWREKEKATKGKALHAECPPLLAQLPYPSPHRAAAEDNLAKVAVPPGTACTQDRPGAHLRLVPPG